MKRNTPVLGSLLLAAALAAGPAASQPLNQIVGQLRAQGYEVVEVRRTWLGRIQIEAQGGGYQREVVFNRVTGEILRDYRTRMASGNAGSTGPGGSGDGPSGSSSRNSGRGGSGSGGDDDDSGSGGDDNSGSGDDDDNSGGGGGDDSSGGGGGGDDDSSGGGDDGGDDD